MSARLVALRLHLLVLLGYALVAAALTFPLLAVGDDAIVGNRIAAKDGWQTVWDIWWWREGLTQQPAHPLVTHYIYWPTGVDMLAYRAYGLTSMLQALPVLFLLGPVAAYKFNIIANFALSGWALFLLARRLIPARWPALAAGLVFTAAPFHLSRFADGYHDLTALQWLPLYLLPLTLWLERGRLAHAVLAMLALTALLLASSYYTQFALVWTALAGVVWSARAIAESSGMPGLAGASPPSGGEASRNTAMLSRFPRLARSWFPLLRATLLLGAWAIFCLPLIRRLAGASIGYADFLLRQELHSLDLVDLLLPSAIHPLWGPFDLHRLTHPYGSWNVVPGIATLLLGCAGLWLARRRLWPWALCGLAMALFAMGPTLFVAGVPVWELMPHDALNLFAAGRASQRPNHFLVLTILALALGVAALLARLRPRLGFGLLALLLLVDCLPTLPWPPLPAPPPSWEAQLAALPEGAVLELPYRPREIDYQVTQLRHGRPIVGGYVSRVPPYPLNNHAALRRLSGTPVETIADAPGETAAFAASLCASALVIHPAHTQVPTATLQATVAALLPEARMLSAEGALVYSLAGPGAAQPLLVLDEGWYALEREGTRRWQWSEPRARLDLINPRAAPMLVRLAFTAYAAEGAQEATLLLDGTPIWRDRFSPTPSRHQLLLRVPPQSSLALTLESQGPQLGRALGLAFSSIQASALPGQQLPCPVAKPLHPGLP
jgi:hypothetical protein